MIDFRILPMNKSPFHDDELEKGKNDKRPTIRLPIETFNRINSYFEDNELNFSQGIKSLIYDKLDMICRERKTFNNLECFMLLPKVKLNENNAEMSVDEYFHILNSWSEIIAIVNTECDFNSDFHNTKHFDDDYNLVYEMKDFKSEHFPMHILRNTKDSCVFRTHKAVLNSFYTFKDRQRELYSNLDVEDCYFVRFPLNNYLDKFRDGQFQQEAFSNTHEGVYVFTALDGLLKYYCFIDWEYSKANNDISFEIYFTSEENFIDDVYNTNDDKLIKSALKVVDGVFIKEKLEDYKSKLADEIEYINHLLDSDE